MKRIAFAVEKGGTGKTTSAVHVAHALALLGHNVLLVDTDSQDQCASHLGLKQFQPGLADLILGEITPRDAILKARERLFLLPAGERLSDVKSRLPEIAANVGLTPNSVLARAMSFTDSGKLAFVIYDTAPGHDNMLINVLAHADVITVPIPPEMQAIRGMKRFFKRVREQGRNVDFILPTIHDRRVSKTFRIMVKLEEHFSEKLLGKISYSSLISEAAGAGMTIFEFKPGHATAREYVAAAKAVAGVN